VALEGQLHLAALLHLAAVVVVETLASLVEPAVLEEEVQVAVRPVKLVQTLHLGGQVLKILELVTKVQEVAVVLEGQEFLALEAVQVSRFLVALLLAEAVVGEN
jgi:hypothetical protein